MKLIAQEDSYGCGVACVAFALNKSYKEALSLFPNGKKRARSIPDFYCRELVWILNNTGRNYEYKYIKPKLRRKIYKTGTIVFIKKSKKYKYGHYLIRYENKWMDPWINFPRLNANAGFRKRLPGRPIYALLEKI
jgi:hypothetical protein